MKKVQLLLLAAGTILLAACAQSTTAPSDLRTHDNGAKPSFDELTCATGYVVVYDENGNPYCAPIEFGATSATSPRRRP